VIASLNGKLRSSLASGDFFYPDDEMEVACSKKLKASKQGRKRLRNFSSHRAK
jgi:hypothetical protein